MKTSIKAFNISMFLFISLFLSSCLAQESNDSIRPLSEIDSTPKDHYFSTSQFSKEASRTDQTLDAISFPDKAMVLVTKLISPKYLEKAEIEELILDFNPPANSSAQTRAELDFLLELQASRTEEQMSEALRMHDVVYFPIVGYRSDEHLFFELYEIFGEDFNPQNYPNTKKLLGNIMKEMRVAEFTAKNHFLRARPRQLEPDLRPLKKMDSSSFASGHTLWAYMQAYIFAELMPEKRDEFLELAYEIGFSREILGVHYPSDEEASRILSHNILLKVWEKPNFKNDFLKAQKEWKMN